MRGVPFTPCKLRVEWGEPPPAGSFLVTAGGSAYRVERSGSTLHCTRWPPEEIPPDSLIIEWSWARRDRRNVVIL